MHDFTRYKHFGQMRINNPAELFDSLREIKHIALDMDGTIYKGKTLFPCTLPFLEKLKTMNISYSFLTNNPSKSTGDYVMHLKGMGITADNAEIFTSTRAAIECLKHYFPRVRRLFVLGTTGMTGEFENAGFEITADNANDRPDAVIVGFDMSLVYSRLCRAAWWINQGLPYLATNPDKICPTDEPTILVDCGSICSCLREATGRNPDITAGKPDPRMLDGILLKHGLQPSQVAMAGDRLYTDIKMARDSGVLGILVLTGESTPEDARLADFPPDITVDDLGILGDMLIYAHKQSKTSSNSKA